MSGKPQNTVQCHLNGVSERDFKRVNNGILLVRHLLYESAFYVVISISLSNQTLTAILQQYEYSF